MIARRIAQNPLHTFPRNFPVDWEAANLLQTCYGETGVMDFGVIWASPESGHRSMERLDVCSYPNDPQFHRLQHAGPS